MLIATTNVDASTIMLYDDNIPDTLPINHLCLTIGNHPARCHFDRCEHCPANDICIATNGSDFHDAILKYFPTVVTDYPEFFI